MPFQRPTLKTLIDRSRTDIQGRLPGSDPLLSNSLLGILAHMQASAVHTLHGYLDWNSQQMLINTAEAEVLEQWSSGWGIYRSAAVVAQGAVTFTGADASVIPIGTTLQRSDGAEFTTDVEVVIASGTALANVTASVAGVDSNTAPASVLALVSPISGVNSNVTVDASGITGGADIESDDKLRERTLSRLQQPPHGGTADDYVAWAMELSGVTRAWSYALEGGAGTVTVRFMMDDAYADGIPLAGDVTNMQAVLDAKAPAVAVVTAVAPVAVPLDISISLNPNTATVQAAVEAQLREYLLNISPGGTVLLSKLNEAISIAAGEIDHNITIPGANITHTINQIPVLGTITWSAL